MLIGAPVGESDLLGDIQVKQLYSSIIRTEKETFVKVRTFIISLIQSISVENRFSPFFSFVLETVRTVFRILWDCV